MEEGETSMVTLISFKDASNKFLSINYLGVAFQKKTHCMRNYVENVKLFH